MKIVQFELIPNLHIGHNSSSYLDLHLEIDIEGRLKHNLYDKRDAFSFTIVKFPFIYKLLLQHSSMASVWCIYILLGKKYQGLYFFNPDFLERGLLRSGKNFKQSSEDNVIYTKVLQTPLLVY